MNTLSILLVILICILAALSIFCIIRRSRRNGPCGLCPYAGSCSGHCTHPEYDRRSKNTTKKSERF